MINVRHDVRVLDSLENRDLSLKVDVVPGPLDRCRFSSELLHRKETAICLSDDLEDFAKLTLAKLLSNIVG
jgi:hypothetical protein